MVFKVETVPSTPEGATIVDKGLQLGYFNKPMTFLITSTIVPKPFPVKITVLDDNEKKDIRIEKDPITESGLEVRIVNPHANSPSSLLEPGSLLKLEGQNVELALQFYLTRLSNAPHFIFYYEFYERPIPVQIQTESKGEKV